MRIRTRIIGAALAVIVVANVIYGAYFIDREHRAAHVRLERTMEETNRLLGSVISGPLYDGNVEQISSDLDSFLVNPDIIRIVLHENPGDINIIRERQSPSSLGELIEHRVQIIREIDELGEIIVTYTTANIELRLQQSTIELLTLSLSSILGLTLVIMIVARGLTRPIDRLTQAARAMADGQLDQDINTGGAQEVEVLGESFVRMRDAIREKIIDLAENNRRLQAEINQRREAEQERDRLISILEATTDIVSMADPDGNLLYLNRAGQLAFGVDPNRQLDKIVTQVHPQWASELILHEAIPTAIRDGVWSGETAVLTTAGQEITVSQVILSHKDDLGRLLYMSTIMRDITERKQAETALRIKDSAIAASINGIAFADLTGCLTYVNQAFLNMWGYQHEEEVVGRSAILFWAEPEEAARVLATLSDQESWSGELTAKRRDGSNFVVWLSATVIRDASGQPVQLTGSFIDVTERKLAEEALRQSDERLRQAVRVSQIGIFDHDQINDCIYWSPEQREIHDWGENEPVTLVDFINLVHPDDRERIGEAVRKAHDPQGDGLFDVEHRIIHRNGEVHWLTTRAQTFFMEVGGVVRPMRTVGAVLDITERKNTEQRLRDLTGELENRVRERTAELEAANRELEAFSYSVSHDLRAPLRAIDGFSSLLAMDYRDKLDDTGLDYITRVRRAVQRMGDLIDDLLKLSRVTRLEIRPAHVDMSRLAREVVEVLQASDRKRQVQVSITDGLEASGDLHLLQMLLANLIENAWKYTGKVEQARIEFGVTQQASEAVFYVRDNGAGFDMQYADKLFTAFQRLHHQDEFPGTGVGLATVARIIQRHGGRVWADAKPGQGATFYFTLTKHSEASV